MRVGSSRSGLPRGQAVVTRQIRSALDGLGHETFVLAKPGKGPRAQQERVADPVWDQPGVTHGSEADIPLADYEAWASDELARRRPLRPERPVRRDRGAPRRGGLRTIGRFVWESFAPEDAGPAQARLRPDLLVHPRRAGALPRLGIEIPLLTWGCHPELIAVGEQRPERGPRSERTRFGSTSPGRFMGKRKPFPEIVEAFTRARGDHLRLLIRGQVDRKATSSRRRPAAIRGSDRARGPPDRRAPAPVRRLPRVPLALALGGPRACRSTRRSRSGCRRSPTTRRR